MTPGSFMSQLQWLAFRNDSGSTVPAFGIVRVTDVADVTAGIVLVGAQPNTYGCQANCFVNSMHDVLDGEYGRCTRSPVLVGLYDDSDGSPAYGDAWGPQNGTWKLKKNTGGFFCLGAPTNTTQFLALFSPVPMTTLEAQAASLTIAPGSPTMTVFWGTLGSETTTSQTLTAYLRRGLLYASKTYRLTFVEGAWEVANPTLSGIGKTNQAVGKSTGAANNVDIYSGTVGSETATGSTLTAWDRYASIASGKWVRWAWNDDSAAFDMVSAEC